MSAGLAIGSASASTWYSEANGERTVQRGDRGVKEAIMRVPHTEHGIVSALATPLRNAAGPPHLRGPWAGSSIRRGSTCTTSLVRVTHGPPEPATDPVQGAVAGGALEGGGEQAQPHGVAVGGAGAAQDAERGSCRGRTGPGSRPWC